MRKYCQRLKMPLLTLIVIALLFALSASGCATDGSQQSSSDMQAAAQKLASAFDSSAMCQTCHRNIVDQHNQSMHAKSFSNPVFQAQYFRELLPRISQSEMLGREADRCIACHDPIGYIRNRGHITSMSQTEPELSGVVCDICHRISSYQGDRPGGGNFTASPGENKFGPFKHASDRHHSYNALQTKSEFCAICHNDVNHNGLEIKSTFTEWEKSSYAKKKISCQDCHMNIQGFLSDGKPSFASGQAASMTIGTNYKRNKIYTHRFPGAHSRTQIEGAIMMGLTVDRAEASAGDEININVQIYNRKAGHSMPSGSADLRMLWLELTAESGGVVMHIPATPSAGDTGLDVAGRAHFDRELFADDIPTGSRMYRTIFTDHSGKPTLSSYDAVKILFDNRLIAEEHRSESYKFKVPPSFRASATIKARLVYLRYPSSFADALSVEKAEPFVMAHNSRDLKIR
jgi:hypothetical protein